MCINAQARQCAGLVLLFRNNPDYFFFKNSISCISCSLIFAGGQNVSSVPGFERSTFVPILPVLIQSRGAPAVAHNGLVV